MALFRVLTRMAAGGGTMPDAYKWSYIWYVEAADPAAAAAVGVDLWNESLAGCHNEYAYCYEIYASDLIESTSLYTVEAIPSGDQRGTLNTGGAGDFYNPNVVARVELNVAGGRPSRKYVRIPLIESWVANGGRNIGLTSVQTALETAFASAIATPGLRDESGNSFSGITYKGLTIRRLGKNARNDLPTPPSFG